MRCIRVVIADQHPVMLRGLNNVLAAERDFKVVAACVDGATCIEAIRVLVPDLAILDIAMPGIPRREILGIASSRNLATRLVFFTAFVDDRDLMMLVAAGACDVISKDAQPGQLAQTLRQIANGPRLLALSSAAGRAQGAMVDKTLTTLTDRERQIMRLVSEGLSNKEIGRRLNISDGTIKVHLHHVFQKLEISNRTVLAALALSAHP